MTTTEDNQGTGNAVERDVALPPSEANPGAGLRREDMPAEQTIYEKRVGGRLVAKFIAPINHDSRIDNLLHELCRPCDGGGNSRPVVVCTVVDQAEYDQRIRENAARPLTQYTFPSAMAASKHFGYGHNAVVQALHKAKGRGDNVAVVAGLQVGWLDEMPGLK
jgi:hypothetical protein